MGYYYRGRYYPTTVDGVLYYYEEAEDEGDEDLEVKADVTFEYDAEPEEPKTRHYPGSPAYLSCTGVTVNGEVTLNGETLEGWEHDAAVRALEAWANSEAADDKVNEALVRALESKADASRDYESEYESRYDRLFNYRW
jgi:hypothetical protein